MTLKIDRINDAFSLMRISGLTVNPSPENLSKALSRSENLAAELEARNICLNYNLEDDPDINSPHNMEQKFWHSFDSILALRLVSDFGKGMPDKIDPMLVNQANAGLSFLSANTAQLVPTQYPSRQPTGSKNRPFINQNFYSKTAEAPISCKTNTMYIDDVDNFIEHFDAWLDDGEVIASYTIEADTGLTVSGDTISTSETDIEYTVTATGVDNSTDSPLLRVKIVVTTDASRVKTRIINFQLKSSEL